jgi:hypothetical protein
MVEDVRFDQSPTALLYKDILIIGINSTHNSTHNKLNTIYINLSAQIGMFFSPKSFLRTLKASLFDKSSSLCQLIE